jgi:glycosyltransferase involved in cell wall biosynthesis
MMAFQPLRLLITTDTVGGVWSYTSELLRTLASHRCEVLLATMGAPLSSSQRAEVAEIPTLTIAESLYKLEWMDDPWAHVDASGSWLMELAHDFRPDIVHLNTYSHGALPWTAPVLMVGHSCVLSWWQAVKGEAAPAEWEPYRQRVQAGLARADLVVAPTQTMLNALQTYYGSFQESQVIYNARHPADFVPRTKENFIFTMGRVWDEAKNIQILDQIAAKVPWPIYVAGDQQHPNGGQVNLANLRTLGPLDQAEVRDWLARASIFVLPALYEPFGLAPLEAALAGCALVLGDIASLVEVWGESACYVQPNNAQMLANVLRNLSERPDHRQELAMAARMRAARYSPVNMGKAYWQAYMKIIAQASTASGVHVQPRAFPTSKWRSAYKSAATPGL